MLFEPAFTLFGQATSWLELIAVVLAFICVAYNVVENPIGWPFAIVSSLAYVWLFTHHKLYGDASVQIYFALAAGWAWWQWLFGRRSGEGDGTTQLAGLKVAYLSIRGRVISIVAWVLLWPAIGLLLDRFTDSDVPYIDAFITAGSVVGQILLGKKFLENWLIWLVVNLASIGMLIYKNLYLSATLYAVFVVMALLGWQRWRSNFTLQHRI